MAGVRLNLAKPEMPNSGRCSGTRLRRVLRFGLHLHEVDAQQATCSAFTCARWCTTHYKPIRRMAHIGTLHLQAQDPTRACRALAFSVLALCWELTSLSRALLRTEAGEHASVLASAALGAPPLRQKEPPRDAQRHDVCCPSAREAGRLWLGLPPLPANEGAMASINLHPRRRGHCSHARIPVT